MIFFKSINDLEYLEISNKNAEAKISLQGAHIFHFQAKNKKPLLWLSQTSHFQNSKAIRGGIPICWPWFGEHQSDITLPNHGFARTALWELIKTEEISDEESKITLTLQSSKDTLNLWPYKFELTLDISISSELVLSLTTKNIDNRAFNITNALHSYFAVSDINNIFVEGLDQKRYYNKTDNSFNNLQGGKLKFTKETDRVYQDIHSPVKLNDLGQNIIITAENSSSVVIWNPWKELAQEMSDLSDYKTMLCIESANVLDDERIIEPNESHQLTIRITQE